MPPSIEQIKAGLGEDKNMYGSLQIEKDIQYNIDITNLIPLQRYHVYMIMEDNFGNLVCSVIDRNFTPYRNFVDSDYNLGDFYASIDGELLSNNYLKKGTTFNATYLVSKDISGTVPTALVISLYDENNKLIKSAVKTSDINSYDYVRVESELLLPSTLSNYVIKVFLLKSFDNMEPITTPVVFEASN
jgi:hypothetical protein